MSFDTFAAIASVSSSLHARALISRWVYRTIMRESSSGWKCARSERSTLICIPSWISSSCRQVECDPRETSFCTFSAVLAPSPYLSRANGRDIIEIQDTTYRYFMKSFQILWSLSNFGILGIFSHSWESWDLDRLNFGERLRLARRRYVNAIVQTCGCVQKCRNRGETTLLAFDVSLCRRRCTFYSARVIICLRQVSSHHRLRE